MSSSYVEYVLDVPMYFVYRKGTYHNVAGQSFRDFLQGKLPGLPGGPGVEGGGGAWGGAAAGGRTGQAELRPCSAAPACGGWRAAERRCVRGGPAVGAHAPATPCPKLASATRPLARCPVPAGELPTLQDWESHMTTVFPEVRLKRFLEMRGADAGPWRLICGLPALWVGLLYDQQAQVQPVCVLRDWCKLHHSRHAPATQGIDRGPLGVHAATAEQQRSICFDLSTQATSGRFLLQAEALALVSDWTQEEREYLREEVTRGALATPFRGGTVQDLAKQVGARPRLRCSPCKMRVCARVRRPNGQRPGAPQPACCLHCLLPSMSRTSRPVAPLFVRLAAGAGHQQGRAGAAWPAGGQVPPGAGGHC